MTIINQKSISGITSITFASAGDDLLTFHSNNGTERFRIDNSGNTKITAGIVTTLSVTGDSSFSGDVDFIGDNYNAVWDKSLNRLKINDNAKAVFGTGADLQIYHNGSHSYIADEGSGELIISGSRIQLMNAARGEKAIDFVQDGAVDIYYDGSKKFETTSTGVTINGAATATEGLTLDGQNGSGKGLRLDLAGSGDYIIQETTTDDVVQFGGTGASNFFVHNISSGRIGIGTASPSSLLHGEVTSGAATLTLKSIATSGEASVSISGKNSSGTARTGIFKYDNADIFRLGTSSGIALRFETNDSTQVHIASSGFIGLQGATSSGGVSSGKTFYIQNDGHCHIAVDNTVPLFLNRNTSDGQIIAIRQNNTLEGNISVSGSTVSLQGAHLTRWSQLVGISTNVISDRPTILRGSVLSNLDEMCEWGDEDNEQLNCMKVSDVEGDPNVAGVFQDWDDDDDTYTNDLNCAMTGDFVIRIAQGTTVARGDLLMSAGDGTAKPQGDDIIRSKTIAKVISTTVSTTYSDGSYCVPCVLMAC